MRIPRCSDLVRILSTTCTDCVYDILREAHVLARQPRIAVESTRGYGTYSSVVHRLKLAYWANLKQCLFQEASEGHSQSVRDLTGIITEKLNRNCGADAAQLGMENIKKMLEHLLEEFQWDASAQIFDECAKRARDAKANAYDKACQRQKQLKKIRGTGDCSGHGSASKLSSGSCLASTE